MMETEQKPKAVQPVQQPSKVDPMFSDDSMRELAESIVASRPGLSVEAVLAELKAH
jgi:hypothetical protein